MEIFFASILLFLFTVFLVASIKGSRVFGIFAGITWFIFVGMIITSGLQIPSGTTEVITSNSTTVITQNYAEAFYVMPDYQRTPTVVMFILMGLFLVVANALNITRK